MPHRASRAFRAAPALCVIAVLLALSAPARAAQGDPADFVAAFADEAAAIAQDRALSNAEAVRAWRALLNRRLDLQALARFAVGPQGWQQANGTQRSQLIELLETDLATGYARWGQEQGEATLAVAGSEPLRQGEWLVTSRLTYADGAAEVLEWRLGTAPDGLRVLDVIADGHSLAAAKRTEFGQILQRNGGNVAALIETLRRRGG